MKEKRLLFSVTKDDVDWYFFRSGGKGGQNQNKVESGARCVHPPSGAVGESREFRDQLHNRRAAWRRMGESKAFQQWANRKAQLESKNIEYVDPDVIVNALMDPENLIIEVRDEFGEWVRE